MSAAQTSTAGRRTIFSLNIPTEEYGYALGYIGRDHDIAVERLDALIANPGNRRELLATLNSIRNEMAGTGETLRGHFERRATAKTGGAA